MYFEVIVVFILCVDNKAVDFRVFALSDTYHSIYAYDSLELQIFTLDVDQILVGEHEAPLLPDSKAILLQDHERALNFFIYI